MPDLSWTVLRLLLLVPFLTALAVADVRTRKLPNAWTLGGLAVGITLQAGWNGWAGVRDALGGAGVCALFLIIPFLVRAAGAGDLKLLAACGSFLGTQESLFLLVAVSIVGFVMALVLLLVRRAGLPRLRHFARTIFDWRYDRRAGAAALPPIDQEAGRIPFAVAIAIGTAATLALELVAR